MAIYKIQWTREQWFEARVEAESKEEAIDKFWIGETTEETLFGEEIQDGIDVERIE